MKFKWKKDIVDVPGKSPEEAYCTQPPGVPAIFGISHVEADKENWYITTVDRQGSRTLPIPFPTAQAAMDCVEDGYNTFDKIVKAQLN